MKTAFTTNLKDNVASAVLLAATFIAIAGSIINSNDAHAVKAAPQLEVQKMDAILVTASRLEQVARMETIVVTASRHVEAAPTFMVASK